MEPLSRAPDEGLNSIAEPMFWATSRRFLRSAIIGITVGAMAFLLVVQLFAPEQHARMVGPAFLLVLTVAAWLLLQRGQVRASVLLLSIGSWILATGICVFNGGVRTPAVIVYPLILIMTGWLLGARTAIVLAALTVAATLGFVVAESYGVLPVQPPTPPAMFWVVQATIFTISAALIGFFLRAYRERIAEVRELSGNVARLKTEAALADTIRRGSYLLDRTGRMAKVGGWELDIANRTLIWTTEVFRIHDLEPGSAPTVDAAIRYYAPEARATIEAAVRDATELGSGYDLELPLVTARGREIWVRTIGDAVCRRQGAAS